MVIASILAHAGHALPRARVTRTSATRARAFPCQNAAHARTVITFGTFDVFHVGHLRVIERAAALGDRLVVGVSADALNLRKKGREPVFSQGERMAIVGALQDGRRGLRRGEPRAEACTTSSSSTPMCS